MDCKRIHRTIPVFIPEMACPSRCVYCNQYLISGQNSMPTDAEIVGEVENYLSTIPMEAEVELGFFGGTFTALPHEEQRRLLELVKPYVDSGRVERLRCSTRPDRVEAEWMKVLESYGMKTVELGVQSLSDAVLKQVGRGYSALQVEESAKKIQEAGMEVGMQMMVGLPGDTPQLSLQTAARIVELGATNTRIYPTLVVKNTVLASQWKRGLYHALSIEEAVKWVAPVLRLFEEKGVTVLRVGLHPTEGFISGEDYLAGPFHVAFKELVMTEIFGGMFKDISREKGSYEILVSRGHLNAAVGHHGVNKKYLESRLGKVRFAEDLGLKNYEFRIKQI